MRIQSKLFIATVVLSFTTTFVLASEVADKPTFSGHAHWYGKELQGHRTASGVVFDKEKLTAAHPNIRFGTMVRVVSKLTNKEVVVEINDRCPARSARVIDLSEAAAKKIGIWPGAKNDVECYVLPVAQK